MAIGRGSALFATVCMAACVACSCMSSPSEAHAATVSELEQQVEAAQQDVADKQQSYDDAKSQLNELMSGNYKSGNTSVADILASSSSVSSVIQSIKYGNVITNEASEKIQAASDARQASEASASELQALLDQKRAQEDSLRNADSIHFAQGDSPWGTLPYWNGTVATHGCGLVSYTVAIDVLTGRGLTPGEMLSLRGDWSGTEQTLSSTTGASGETHSDETLRLFDVTSESLDMSGNLNDEVDEALEGEGVVQVCAAGTAFKNNDGYWRTSAGHYVTIYRHDANGYYVQDSTWSGAKGAAVCYSTSDLNVLLSHCHSLTAYRN